MAKVHFPQHNISIEIAAGTRVTDCIRAAGLALETPCNCIGICGKCQVRAWGDLYPPEDLERKFIDAKDTRVACQAMVKGEAWLELPTQDKSLKTINKGFAIEVEVDSPVKLVPLPPFAATSEPFLEQLPYPYDLAEVYRKAGECEAAKARELYGVIYDNRLIDLCSKPEEILGVAVDVGTTGISAYLIDLATGAILNKVSSLNPQTQYGGDVLSRISYCLENPEGTAQLQQAIIGKINELVTELTGSTARTQRVFRVVIAGNTTMQHFLLGVYPGTIAKAPYRPVFLAQVEISPAEAGLHIHKAGSVILLPSASGYVGADILAGVAATAFDKKEYPAIFLDIGTNGEIVANLGGRLIATSTAAGPALEGMNISWGCRAEAGAIDTFSIDDNFTLHFSTIDGAAPKGICGSGLLDVAAALVQKEIILPSGRFNPQADARVKERMRDKKFYITDEIYLSQKDIRQLQLAKGAMAAGSAMLLEKAGIPIEDIEEAVIAGAFGYHINQASIRQIGLLPKGFRGKMTFVGNSAAEGARLALLSKSFMASVSELKNRLEVLELSTDPRFQDYFVNALGFKG